jgi:hypothetical protein
MISRSPDLLRNRLLRLCSVRGFGPFDDQFERGPVGGSDDSWGYRSGDSREAEAWPAHAGASESRRAARSGARATSRAADDGGLGLSGPSLRRKLPALTGLALAAVLVALGTIGVEAQLITRSHAPGSGTGVTTASGTPTATFVPLPTATFPAAPTPVNLAALGWAKRTLSWVERVAAAPSAPSTVYGCGGLAGQNSYTIQLAVSQDSGHTWNTLSTGVQAAHCYDIEVSPSAQQAVSIHVDTCPSDCGADQQMTSYTLDGGAHWSPISPPVAAGNAQPDDGFASGWVGTTLFAIPGNPPAPQPSSQFLAKSANGGPFTWLNLPVDNQPGPLFTTSNTIYAVRNSDVYKSTDLGAAWSKASAAYNGNPVTPLAMAPGAAMLGIDARWQKDPNPASDYPLLRSTDGGATWQPEPDMPAGMRITAGVFETPDGSIYLTAIGEVGQALGQGGIYKLAPGASQWRLLSQVLPGDLRLMGVTWNASGQPLTLWGVTQAHPNTSDATTILYSHAA